MPASARTTPLLLLRTTIPALILALTIALGAPPAHAAHVTCGEVITEDTTLDSDLVNCPEHGVEIGADNITLDLGGHMIDGDPEGFFDAGVDNSAGYDGVTIKNGTVREFDVGVSLVGTTHNNIDTLEVAPSRYQTGILLDGFGSLDSSSNRIERVVVQGNSGIGMYVNGSSDNFITKNTITGNGTGADFFASRFNRFEKNLVSVNSSGVMLNESHGNRVAHNTLTRNQFHGLFILGSNDNVVESNLVLGRGIGIGGSYRGGFGSNRNAVLKNTVRGSIDDGISVAGPFHDENFPDPGARETLLEGNVTIGNADDGIDVRAPSTTLTKNRANDNGDYGIEAVPGVTDGGGNRAKGNGNPQQCLNVVCH